jgi:hypothetical protein
MRILVLLLCTIAAAAQTAPTQAPASAPLELDGTQQRPVLLTPQQVIRAADEPQPAGLTLMQRATQAYERIYDGMVNVELSVVINLNGRVESAKPINGPQRFLGQAVEIEMHRAFEPVHDSDGTIVRAHFTDYVSVEPPEQWLEHLLTYAIEHCRPNTPEDNQNILKMLLEAGADPNQETERDKPALFAVNYALELVPLLVAGGAQVNLRDSGGFLPLMTSTDPKALRALLDEGADPTLRNRKGQTAGEWFRAMGLKEQADLLDAAVKARLEQPATQPLQQGAP